MKRSAVNGQQQKLFKPCHIESHSHPPRAKYSCKLAKLSLINRSVRSWVEYYLEKSSSVPVSTGRLNTSAAAAASHETSFSSPSVPSSSLSASSSLSKSSVSSTLTALRPILISMSLVGLDFIPTESIQQSSSSSSLLLFSRRTSLYWNYFILSLVILSFLHNVGCQTFLLFHGAPNDALYSFFSCTKLFCSLLVLILFYSRKKTISQLLIDIDENFQIVPHSTLTRPHFCAQLRRKVLIDVTLGWSLLILFIYTNFASNLSEEDMRKYLHDYWFGLHMETIGTVCTALITLVETTVYFLATVAPMQFFAIYYILLCNFMKILFHMFNEWAHLHAKKIAEAENEVSLMGNGIGVGVGHSDSQARLLSSQVRQFRLTHNRLTKMVYRMDHHLSLLTLLVYIIIMSDLSKYVYYLIERLTKKWEDSFEVMFVGFRVSHMLWLFFNVSFSAALMSEESLASASDFHDLSSYSHFTFSKIDQSHQILGILIKLSGQPSQLTGWNLFTIDRGFVLTVLGVVLTYSLVLFQMTPWAQQPGE